jgi:hypothetical protein
MERIPTFREFRLLGRGRENLAITLLGAALAANSLQNPWPPTSHPLTHASYLSAIRQVGREPEGVTGLLHLVEELIRQNSSISSRVRPLVSGTK